MPATSPRETIARYAERPVFVITAGFAICLLFQIFGPYIKYPGAGYVDPWIYTGYFTNFTNTNLFHGTLYYFSRLPWTLPAALAFQLATPAVASILLNTCMAAASAISLYYAVRWHYGTAPALLTSLGLVVDPYFNSAVGWDYPDGPAIAYGFVAAAFAVRPHGRRTLNTILMAVFLALSGFTNMSGAPMILAILVFPLWRQRHSAVELAKEAGYILAGVAGAGLALLPVSKAVLGYWSFFMGQIKMAQYELGTPGVLTHMWGSGIGFLLGAYRLFPPVFLLLFGLVVFRMARKRKPIAWPSYIALLTCCALYAYQEFVMHGVALRVRYHCVYLVVPLFLLAGVVLGELWQVQTWRHDWIVVAALVLFVMAMPFLYDAWRQDLPQNMWGDVFVAGAAALVLLAGWRISPAIFRIPLAVLMAGLLFASPARELSILLSLQRSNPEDFQALMNMQTLLKMSKPANREALFWVDQGELHNNLFVSAQSMWVLAPTDFAQFVRSASSEELKSRLQNSPTLVHLTDHPEKITERMKLLDSRGVHYENQRQWLVREGQTQFYVAAEDLTDIWGIH